MKQKRLTTVFDVILRVCHPNRFAEMRICGDTAYNEGIFNERYLSNFDLKWIKQNFDGSIDKLFETLELNSESIQFLVENGYTVYIDFAVSFPNKGEIFSIPVTSLQLMKFAEIGVEVEFTFYPGDQLLNHLYFF